MNSEESCHSVSSKRFLTLLTNCSSGEEPCLVTNHARLGGYPRPIASPTEHNEFFEDRWTGAWDVASESDSESD